jgi:hypothetical protein
MYPDQATHNAKTWGGGQGGIIEAQMTKGGRDIQDRTGGDEWPTDVRVVDKFAEVILIVREPLAAALPAIGDKSDLAVTLTTKTSTSVRTFTDMVCVDNDMRQLRATPSATVLRFVYEADTESTAPE